MYMWYQVSLCTPLFTGGYLIYMLVSMYLNTKLSVQMKLYGGADFLVASSGNQ